MVVARAMMVLDMYALKNHLLHRRQQRQFELVM
jgi:hypothetical protein